MSLVEAPKTRTALWVKLASVRASRRMRGLREVAFKIVSLTALGASLAVLLVLLGSVYWDGAGRLNWEFLTSFASRRAANAGVVAALAGSVWMMALTAVIAIPFGVGAAIYLEEYAPQDSSWKGRLAYLIEINIANLAAVPSILYGLLGLAIFVRALDLGRSLLAGSLTLSLLILPIIIIASREAIRTVPRTIREGSYALGATQWQTIRHHVLPMALPGILTGTILALSRAIGETAPLITIGALTYVAFLPENLLSPFTVMPIQIFNWVSRPQADFHVNAAAAICVLLPMLLAMNGLAIWLRQRYQKENR